MEKEGAIISRNQQTLIFTNTYFNIFIPTMHEIKQEQKLKCKHYPQHLLYTLLSFD
jgi:hypothetical protein